MARATLTKRCPRSTPPSATLDIALLEDTFAALAPQGEILVQRFYEELFRRYPQLAPLFAHINSKQQQQKLLAALALVVQSLRKPQALHKTLRALGARHQRCGVQPEHYEAVASTLLDVMQECAGELWTPAVQRAWSTALQSIATIMIEAYQTQEQSAMAGQKKGK